MNSLAKSAVPIVALVITSVMAAVAIFFTVSNVSFRPQQTYQAQFKDVSGMKEGSDVEIAGVAVGRVEQLQRLDNNVVQVQFTVRNELPVLRGSRVLIRYKDLVGRRVLEIQQGEPSSGRLSPGGTLPVTQTAPALDLDELYNSFSPLFEGLQPDQINQLSTSLVQVLQGQQGTVDSLLGQVGTLSSTLADRDAVIGSLIKNLNSVVGTVQQRGANTSALVDRLQQLTTGLARERGTVSTALERTNAFAAPLQGLVQDARPDIAGNVSEVDRLSRVINRDQPELDTLLKRVPGYYQIAGRVGTYQSAFQFYLCGVQVRADSSPAGPAIQTPMIRSQEQRCHH